MLTLQLSYEDFRRIARLFQSINVSQLPSGFNFKRYLVGLLRLKSPVAASRLEVMSDEEMSLLREEVEELQKTAG